MRQYRVNETLDTNGCIIERSLEPMSSDDYNRLRDRSGVERSAGFVDLYARLCEPGLNRKGTIESECAAALANGITSVVCAPDTQPAIDTTPTVELVHHRAESAGFARALPMGALTRNLDGQHLSEMATLSSAGCIAFGQADRCLDNTGVLLSAMEYAATFDLPLFLTPRDGMVATDGCAHAGATASALGLPGIPVEAETVALSKLIELARSTTCKLHVSRLSSARAVELVRDAKESGLSITADVGVHHLYFTDEQLAGFDVNFHSAVPFRSCADRAALRQGVTDGTLDAICSDHSPHDLDSKLAPFPASAPGLSALDFFLPLVLGLPRLLNVSEDIIFKCITTSPRNILNHTDSTDDEVLFDREVPVCLLSSALISGGINSPLIGHDSLLPISGESLPLLGKVLAVRSS